MSQNTSPADNEKRWSAGAWAAAVFALLIFGYNAVGALTSAGLPTDGWAISGDITTAEPHIIFTSQFSRGPTLLRPGDELLAINGYSVEALLEAQHDIFHMKSPNWADGTVLHYEVLREGAPVSLEVPSRRIPYWSYYGLLGEIDPANLTQLAGSLLFFSVGLAVFLLRPSNRAAHALLFIGVGFFFNAVPSNFTAPTLFYPDTPVSIPFDTWTLAINPSLMYLALAFPFPKLPLRRFPRLGVLLLYLPWLLAFNLAYLLNLDDRQGYLKAAFAIYPVQVFLMMGIVLASLIHSAITVRDPVGRSQFKWMVAGTSSFVFLGVGGWLVSTYLFPETMEQGNWLLTTIGWFLLPICLAIAITRYRLFDIDVIIRRTLVYSILSGLLGVVYFGSVTVLQGVFTSLGGSQTPVITVISTLGIAALFSPLRKRIQEFIDRRFFRSKYNAEQALSTFAAAARAETNLELLSGSLVLTIQETLQPKDASLWLLQARPERHRY
jgi:hypothetical protein